ncbi:MAG TPA: magnesium transporter [Polyangiaceae bacterium]|nr:magnesium transporter [Polyangiaceae bacterium]
MPDPDEPTKPAAPRENPADLAELLSELEDEEIRERWTRLDPRQRVAVFEYLDQDARERLAAMIPKERLAELLEHMCSDDRAAFLRHLPEALRTELITLLSPREQRDVLGLMRFPEESAGALMSTEYAALDADLGAAAAVDELRRSAPSRETIYTVYVVDRERRLLGTVSLLKLVTADPDERVRDLMSPGGISIPALAEQEEVARVIAKYDLTAVPIVDERGRLLGIVTHDDALDLVMRIRDEAAALASGIEPDPVDTPYSRTSIRLLFKRRVSWLLGLMLLALVSATVVSFFRDTLTAVVALAFFIPVVTGTGGNTGTQSATLIIRALGTEDVSPSDWARVFAKELVVGAVLGAALAVTIAVIGLAWPSARGVAPIVGATMVALVLWANLVGALLPILLRRMGIDPAIAGAPLVSTVVDATGLIIYLGVAKLWLDG